MVPTVGRLRPLCTCMLMRQLYSSACNNSAHYTFFSVFYSSLDYKECDPLLGEHRKDCPPHSNCKDSYGSYTCECEIGYENHSTEPNFCVRKGDESTFATSNIAVGFTCSIDLNVHDDNSDFYP
jgi:hypothetical protein